MLYKAILRSQVHDIQDGDIYKGLQFEELE